MLVVVEICGYLLVFSGIFWYLLVFAYICLYTLAFAYICLYLLVLLVFVGIFWYLLIFVGICWYVLVFASICWYLLVFVSMCLYLLGFVQVIAIAWSPDHQGKQSVCLSEMWLKTMELELLVELIIPLDAIPSQLLSFYIGLCWTEQWILLFLSYNSSALTRSKVDQTWPHTHTCWTASNS